MRVAFVASEVNPIAKVGGLGDVIGALPKTLRRLGVEPVIITGYYGTHDENKYPTHAVARAKLSWGDGELDYTVRQGLLPGSDITVYLIDQTLIVGSGGVYDSRTAIASAQPEIERFLFLAKASAHLPEIVNFKPELWHLHDWHAAAVAAFLPAEHAPTLLTIHNLANQGWASAVTAAKAGLVTNQGEQLNIFKLGLEKATWLSTVSPTYAKEIQTKEFGEGLAEVLQARQHELTGIVNGLDTDFFNPRTDAFLFVKLDKNIAEFKQQNKLALQTQLGLGKSNAPLFGMVSRLTSQKGVELIMPALEKYLAREKLQFVCLGVGEPALEQALRNLAARFPKLVSTQFAFNEHLAHMIYAGSDFFLMPSRFEPCGLGQLIAMRYGTVPIVRATGGLKDTVVDVWHKAGTGFVFNDYNSLALAQGIGRALELYGSRVKLERVRQRAMGRDFSWRRSAQAYLELYKRLCANLPQN